MCERQTDEEGTMKATYDKIEDGSIWVSPDPGGAATQHVNEDAGRRPQVGGEPVTFAGGFLGAPVSRWAGREAVGGSVVMRNLLGCSKVGQDYLRGAVSHQQVVRCTNARRNNNNNERDFSSTHLLRKVGVQCALH